MISDSQNYELKIMKTEEQGKRKRKKLDILILKHEIGFLNFS